jgi:hypothetical protein
MTDLETRLRSAGEDLRLDRPVTQVIARGAVLRRRRRSRVALAAAAAVTAVVVPASALLEAGGSSSRATSGAPPAVRIDRVELESADRQCRSVIDLGTLADVTRSEVFGAGTFGNDTVLLYRATSAGTGYGICNVVGDGAIGWGGRPGGPGIEAPTAARPLSADDARVVDGRTDGEGALLDVGLVGPEVDRVVAVIGGKDVVASVDDGWFWLGTAITHAPGDDSTPEITLRAYDADGDLVDEMTLPAMGSVTDLVTGR